MERIIQQIDRLLSRQERVWVAIDGCCASGKSTLANQLAQHYSCTLFHMDDFFLRPEQRTSQRYAEVGGNVDYERFMEEILLPLKTGLPFSYRPFDCQTMALADSVSVTPGKLAIIEGSYSQHPYFGDPYDLTVYLSVSPELQRERILHRPAFLHRRFFEEWIPMENRYFAECSIEENADLVLHT